MTVTTWSVVFVHGATSFRYFAYHLLFQPVALTCFSYGKGRIHPDSQVLTCVICSGILTLQPTSQPRTKAAGLNRHQTAFLTTGFPVIALGTLAIVYNKYLGGYEHYRTWHAVSSDVFPNMKAHWILRQGWNRNWVWLVWYGWLHSYLLVPGAPGMMVHCLVEARRRRQCGSIIGRYIAVPHWMLPSDNLRLSGYILFGLMLFTVHLGGARSEWGHDYVNDLARFVAYTLSPGLITAGVCLRVR